MKSNDLWARWLGVVLFVLVATGASAAYDIVADVFTAGDCGVALRSDRYTVTVSVGQRCLVGPRVKTRKVVLDTGYQAMITGLGLLPAERFLSDREKRRLVEDVLGKMAGLYGYAGVLDYDAARALVQQREASMDAFIETLAGLGPGGARIINSFFTDEQSTRIKVAMIKALGLIDDSDAAAVLSELYGANDQFSMQKEIIVALGKRPEGRSGQTLSGLLNSADNRVGMVAAQGLVGRPEAIPVLAEAVVSEETDSDVRREAIRSLGLAKSADAMGSLADVALAGRDNLVRLTAIQELGRSYGGSSLDTLEALLADPDEKIRSNAVKAIFRVKTPRAQSLLRRAAELDESAAVRNRAEVYLSTKTEEAQP